MSKLQGIDILDASLTRVGHAPFQDDDYAIASETCQKWLTFVVGGDTHLAKCSNVKNKRIGRVLVCYLPG